MACYGYARVSTKDQNEDRQIIALREMRVPMQNIYVDREYLGFAVAIKIDDPGPVLFTQRRIGKNKKYFKLHKFRSMKMATPHDIPTHMLDNPEQYITNVGKFMRKHSIDELPQIYDIFIGNMSIIGPRPALWNQDVLTAERDKYGANDIRPGLTGWAQINGRDELELPEKATGVSRCKQNVTRRLLLLKVRLSQSNLYMKQRRKDLNDLIKHNLLTRFFE